MTTATAVLTDAETRFGMRPASGRWFRCCDCGARVYLDLAEPLPPAWRTSQVRRPYRVDTTYHCGCTLSLTGGDR